MIRNQLVTRRLVSAAVALLVAALLPCPGLEAQEIRATLTGTVRDAQGASMPGVAVTVLNVDTNVASETATDAQGGYTLPKLPPGRYRVTAALPGFKTFVRDGIVLRTAETGTVNLQLELGTVEEIVTVTASLSEVESNRSTLAQTMENKRISELPLNGRQVYMLLQLTSGTLFTQTQFGAQGFSGTRAWDVNGSVTIHGSRVGQNEFLIDGGAIGGTGGWSYAPPVDAIEEFKVQTASTDASYGRTSGGVVNLTLKSGTNTLHGSGNVLVRGTALDANQIQNIRNNISNEGHEYVNGEFTVSGPLQKDKTFFMVGYQGFRENIPFPATSTVPTDLQRLGDFSQTFNSAGQLIVIYDPLTTRADPTRAGRLVRDPFPGNRIPAGRINPIARALMDQVPRANAAGSITGANNFINSPNLGFYRYHSYLVRLDHRFSADHRISLSNSGNWGNERRSENGLPPGPALRSDNWPTQRKNYLAVVDDVVTLNSTTMLNTRLSFDRFDEPHAKEFGPLGSTALPFATRYQLTDEPWYPHITWGGYTEMFGRPERLARNDVASAQTSVSKSASRHFLKLGAEFRTYRLTRFDFNDLNGLFNFNAGFTQRDPQQGEATAGNAAASFLLGYPANGQVNINPESLRRYDYYALYLQDEWKINSRATFSLGLRWDYQSPVKEKNDEIIVGFDRTTPSPLQVPGLQVRGGLLYAGVDGNPRSPYSGDRNNIQPRANFAYKLSERLGLRASYGRSYFAMTGGGIEGINQNPGFGQTTSIVTSVQTGIPFNTLTNPYPEGFLQPLGSSLGLATGIGTGFSFQNPDFKIPYTDQWMLGVNIELPWDVGLNLAYVGNRITDLAVGRNINSEPRSEREKAIEALGGSAGYLNAQLPNPFAGRVPGTGLNTATWSRQQSLRPFPQFGQISMNLDNAGYAKYNAFEMVLSKRFSRGLAATVNYTWSRLREATDFLNNGFEADPFEDVGGQDRTHHLTVTALYELPFKGNRLVEGWQVNFLYEYASGTPVNFPNNGFLRPNETGTLAGGEQCIGNDRGCRWFDNSTRTNPRPDGGYAWDSYAPNAFRRPPFRFSNIRNPYISTMSISLFKNTRIGRTTVQLRGELFNPLNTRYYGGPNVDVNSASFGQITPSQFNMPRQGQLGLRFYF